MRISCIIPTLDRSEMLQETLRSVFTQTRAVDEIIVVDNGTQPPTISAEYAPRVKVIRLSSHSGVSKARNAGAAEATGEILAFLDDDDLWNPDYIKNVEKAFTEGADCVVSRLDSMEDGRIVPHKNADTLLTLENLLMFNPGITGSNIALKKAVFSSVGGFDEHLPTSEDKSLVIELLRSGARIATLPDNQAIRRVHAEARLTDPRTLATGVDRFTAKYRELMDWPTYFFNRRKSFRLRVDGGTLSAYPALILYALLYRLTKRKA